MNKIIENNLDTIQNLCDTYLVESLFLFGSANMERFDSKSDIDFLISFKDELPLLDYADNFFNLQFALKKLFKRDVDLVVEKSLKNPYLIQEIEKSKVKIYGN